jgi:hypothetical protein
VNASGLNDETPKHTIEAVRSGVEVQKRRDKKKKRGKQEKTRAQLLGAKEKSRSSSAGRREISIKVLK